ncbi:MAG: 3-hydroxyacyl-CoA dehydrogenase [Proteobacteria bacterium]|nr:3-hydroxyacyl-CoA dehydrogenase [Pseudomonadota bacterium]
MVDATGKDLTMGVVGAGAMGRGIAQVAAVGGINTVIFDTMAGVAENAVGFIDKMLGRQIEKGQLEEAAAAAAMQRLVRADDLNDLASCDVVVEAVVEDLDAKQSLFRELETIVRPNAILASNTSSLRIASIASACEHRSRVGGLHFFNPVPLMKLVEVVRAPDTADDVVAALCTLGERMGRTAVIVRDGPGFLVNFGGRAYYTEGLRIVHEQSATPAQIDAVMRDCCGFRMGPFELMDLTGVDVNFPASSIIYNGYFHDRRIATTPLHESLFASGRLGRKTRSGYYSYDENGVKIGADADAKSSAEPATAVALAEPDQVLADFLTETGARIVQDDGTVPIIAAPLGEDCTAVASRTGIDHQRLVAIDLSADATSRITVMTAPGANLAVRDQVIARLAVSGRAVTAIHDSAGFISQRIRAMVANLGCEIAQLGIASPNDVNTAMRLGLNYPQGPIDLADQMGPATLLAILSNLQAITGDDRYRPSQWLRRRALLGLAAGTPD